MYTLGIKGAHPWFFGLSWQEKPLLVQYVYSQLNRSLGLNLFKNQSYFPSVLSKLNLEWVRTAQVITKFWTGDLLCHRQVIYPLSYIPIWMTGSSKVSFIKYVSHNVFRLIPYGTNLVLYKPYSLPCRTGFIYNPLQSLFKPKHQVGSIRNHQGSSWRQSGPLGLWVYPTKLLSYQFVPRLMLLSNTY